MEAKEMKRVFSENLNRYMDSRGINQTDLAARLNIPKMTMNNWVNGNTYPRPDKLQMLADFFGVRKSDLTDKKQGNVVKESSASYNYIPAEISAGLPDHVEAITDTEQIKIPDSLMGKWAGDNSIYITTVNGESMNRIIPHNSLIAVRPVPLEQLKNNDIVVYAKDNEYAVKRIIIDNDRLIFKPESHDQTFTDDVVYLDDDVNVKIKGKVVLYIVEIS